MPQHVHRVRVKGYRSLRDVDLTGLEQATVLIGPNGSGKSNLLGVIRMLRMIGTQQLQRYVGDSGGASFLLHYGPSVTPVMEIGLEFSGEESENAYSCRLAHAAGESLIFVDERAGFRRDRDRDWTWVELGAGHRESRLHEFSESDTTVRTVRWYLQRLNFFHFHDTSPESELRTNARLVDDQYLRSNGSNLPSYLLALKESDDESHRAAFSRIESLVRQIAPFIHEIEPTQQGSQAVRLDWVDQRNERFGSAHLSDGTLRALALFTALGQPVDMLPLLCTIDEPELGLHPAALHLFCDLVRSVTAHHQVLVATQSPSVLDRFEPNEVLVAEWVDGQTQVRRLDGEALNTWLQDYTLSDLYDSNLLGGRP